MQFRTAFRGGFRDWGPADFTDPSDNSYPSELSDPSDKSEASETSAASVKSEGSELSEGSVSVRSVKSAGGVAFLAISGREFVEVEQIV